jgi:hypothetical protein
MWVGCCKTVDERVRMKNVKIKAHSNIHVKDAAIGLPERAVGRVGTSPAAMATLRRAARRRTLSDWGVGQRLLHDENVFRLRVEFSWLDGGKIDGSRSSFYRKNGALV